jgi:hypothetical protein
MHTEALTLVMQTNQSQLQKNLTKTSAFFQLMLSQFGLVTVTTLPSTTVALSLPGFQASIL